MIYVCSPFRGDTETNIKNAKEYCKWACEAGEIPFAPHLFFTQFLNDDIPAERLQGINYGKTILSRFCSQIWVFGNVITDGMKAEIEYAERHGIGVKYIKC